jgi:uncharacterized protein (TIGR02246 family)
VAAFWTSDGDYVDPSGRVLLGRPAIEKDFEQLFAENKGLKLRIEVASLKFPTPDTAVEDGTTGVLAPDGTVPSRARYTNFFTKKNGQWLLASVREAAYVQPSNYGNLRELERVIGEWVDENPGGELGLIHLVARSKLHHLHPLG